MNPTDKSLLAGFENALGGIDPLRRTGVVTEVTGLIVQSTGPLAAVGEVCEIESSQGRRILVQVVGFRDGQLLSMPLEETDGLVAGSSIVARADESSIRVSPALLGRVLDGYGRPMDGLPALESGVPYALQAPPPNPMERRHITERLVTGVRAIDGMLPIGKGQRVGIFGGSGVGKSVLLGSLAKHNSADVTVVGLIGERNREVLEFIDHELGPEGLKRSVVVVATSDRPAPLRVRAALTCTAIAEYFRDQGLDVLLIMDSVTRLAMAQREIGLAVGEIPASRGYPPSVFGRISSLCERAGNGAEGSGGITAFYTVLVEGDDPNDPVGDSARSILDGHLVLSRRLADRGHFPALDVGASVSRVMPAVVPPAQMWQAQRLKQLFNRLEESRDIIAIGGYRPGHDAELDRAVALQPAITEFLCQDMTNAVRFSESVAALGGIVGGQA